MSKTIEIAGLTKADALTKLIQSGMDFKTAEQYYKENGDGTRRAVSGGFTDLIAFLGEAPRTQRELYEWVLEFGTSNEARWITNRDAIRKLSVEIFKKGGENFQEVNASPSLKEEVKSKVK